ALLDFLYLAQYPIHTDKILILLEQSLQSFMKIEIYSLSLKYDRPTTFPSFIEWYQPKLSLNV
ncbi:hypothetical protein BDQ17DRAFT_1258161, partial [Cyathus striatus]